MSDDKIKHLEFLQNIISRMNTNSFRLKTFCITISSTILALFASNKNEYFVLVGFFPIILFWFLDSYYLQQERKFRCVYNIVSGLKNDISIKSFEMPIHKFNKGNCSYWNVFFSKTIVFFYLPIIILFVIIYIVFNKELL